MSNLALLGHPIDFSLSPSLFRLLREALANDGRVDLLSVRYLLIDLQRPTDLPSIFSRCELLGVNVTRPLKEAFLPQLKELSEQARTSGAVNCIRYNRGYFVGHNSDVTGVRAMLRGQFPKGLSGPLFLLGAGGAARSVLSAIGGFSDQIFITNRNASRAEALAVEFGVSAVDWSSGLLHLPSSSVLFSTVPHEALLPPIDWDNVATVFDSVYIARPYSQLQREVVLRGIPYRDGLEWLLAQALEAYNFFGIAHAITSEKFRNLLTSPSFFAEADSCRVTMTTFPKDLGNLQEGVVYYGLS